MSILFLRRRITFCRFLEDVNIHIFKGVNPITMVIQKNAHSQDIFGGWGFLDEDRMDTVDTVVIHRSAKERTVEEVITLLGWRQPDVNGREFWVWPHMRTLKIRAHGYVPEDLLAMVQRRIKFALAYPTALAHLTHLHISAESPMDRRTFEKLEGLIGEGNLEWEGQCDCDLVSKTTRVFPSTFFLSGHRVRTDGVCSASRRIVVFRSSRK